MFFLHYVTLSKTQINKLEKPMENFLSKQRGLESLIRKYGNSLLHAVHKGVLALD